MRELTIHALLRNLKEGEELDRIDLEDALGWALKAKLADPILLEAASIVDEARESVYGNPIENWETVAAIVNSLFEVRPNRYSTITADDLLVVMQVVKLVRSVRSPEYRDNHLDMIGYSVIRSRINS